jgi:hypothetical protein
LGTAETLQDRIIRIEQIRDTYPDGHIQIAAIEAQLAMLRFRLSCACHRGL